MDAEHGLRFDSKTLPGWPHVPGVLHVDNVQGPLIVRDSGPGDDGAAVDSTGRILSAGTIHAPFTIHGGRVRACPLQGVLQYVVEDGRLRLKQVQLLQTTSRDREVTSSMIRSLPFTELRDDVVRIIEHDTKGSAEGLHWSLRDFEGVQPRRKGRRRTVTVDMLLEVAADYAGARDEVDPYGVLAQRSSYSRDYLRQLVARARKEGLLAEARPGVRNHDLTARAFRLLDERGRTQGGAGDGTR